MVKKIVELMLGKIVIKNSQNEKLLGAFFDEKPTFGYHIENICMKASRKLEALERVAPYMDLSKRKFLMNAFSICSLATTSLYGCVIAVH